LVPERIVHQEIEGKEAVWISALNGQSSEITGVIQVLRNVLDVLAVLRLLEVGQILEVGHESFVAQVFRLV